MSSSVNPFDLKRQLAFYGAYHTNPTNVAIHIIGVPSIIFATSIYLASFGSLFPALQRLSPHAAALLSQLASNAAALPLPLPTTYAALTPAALFMGLYLAYYAILDPLAASLLAPIWYSLYYYSSHIAATHPDALKISYFIFGLGWVAQFYGHGVHERRAPALLDNLLGAVVLAPFFVFLEVIFHLGYRPQLQKWLKNETGRLVAEFRINKAASKRAKAN